MTLQEVQAFFERKIQIDAEIQDIACAVADIRKTLYKGHPVECYVDYVMEGQEITAHFELRHCGCCPPDDLYVSFPMSYLWTPNCIEIEKASWEAHLVAQAAAKAAADAAEEEQRRADKERKDREQYERLKAKYEGK